MAAVLKPLAAEASRPGAPGVSLGDPDLPEGQLVDTLQAALAPHAAVLRAADAEGTALAAGMAGHARATLALRLLAAFPLTGAEGQALMRMTEALLRIPDPATAVQLLADELGAAAWQPRTRDPAARAAAWALRAGSALLRGPGGRARAGLGAPALAVARRFVHHFGGQFVFSDAIEHAVSRLRPGASYSFDMLGEQALNAADVQRFHAAYLQAIRTLGPLRQQGRDVGISIKLSALHPRYGAWQRERVLHELVPRVQQLVDAARGFDLPVCIDAEEAARLELSIDVFDALSAAVRGWGGLGLAVQAYQTRALAVLREVERLAQRDARRIPVRLVKGAYWDSEIKRAQAEGLPGYPVYTRKEHTDLSYLACAAQMLGSPHIRAAFATHNAYSFAAVRALAQAAGRERDFEFQCLHGMGEPLYDAARAQGRLGVPVRIYAPVGAFDALLPYLVRRLLENGANTSFLHQLATADAAAGNSALLALRDATPAIAAPAALFGARRNARGVDLQRADVARAFCATPLPQVHAVPVYTPTSEQNALGSNPMLHPVPVLNPATGAAVGSVRWADAGDVSQALAAARSAAPGWAATPVPRRAQCLQAWGDALEQGMAHFSALAVAEAGKTWPNAVADVREAIDFCRYYAQLAQGTAGGEPLGVVATIAPWNFPLAIFTGQVAAALAAGNVVVAKPAEQTPLMAFEAVRAAHAAGVPAEVLHLLPGGGDVGAALVQDARVDGVMFTGSLQVAKLIERNLHRRAQTREVPLIAETSGVNAMIVDSSALLDQAVQDVVASAFDSAGQRCSALRLLWVQDDVAERFIEALRGAMAELTLGDPALLSTDIGPVIDDEALQRLQAHERLLQRDARLIARVPLPAGMPGHFFAPCAYEVATLAPVAQETFGPVLHVKRYAARELAQVIERTAALGFALTFGVHTRLRSQVADVSARAPGGNLYINRNMIGAVVGSQPFGGGRKSGTGPKAGGPWALLRLMRSAPQPVPGLGPDGRPAAPQRLPSITGEHNTWQLVPRGVVACTGPDAQALAAQLALCASLGVPAVDACAAPQALARPDLGAVLRAQWDADFAGQLASQREDLLPLVTASGAGYAAWRLFEERVISDNVAAAGGNVELLTA